jgi:chromosome partitioning protein
VKVLSISNQKGGVGKTTTAINLAYGLAAAGRRILLVDMDPQSSLTMAVGADPQHGSIADVLGGSKTGRLTMGDIIMPLAERLDLAPAALDLAGCELELTQRLGRESVLKKAFSMIVENYDLVILDSGPSLGLLVINAIVAADAIIIPVIPDALGLRGLALFLQSLETIRAELNPGLVIMGCVVCQFDKRTTLHKAALERLKEEKIPVLAVVKKSVAAARAVGFGKPITSGELRDQYAVLTAEVEKWQKTIWAE